MSKQIQVESQKLKWSTPHNSTCGKQAVIQFPWFREYALVRPLIFMLSNFTSAEDMGFWQQI